MLVRLRNLWPAIDLLTQRDPILQKQSLQLDDHDWSWIKRLTDILEVFHEPTVIVTGTPGHAQKGPDRGTSENR
jgi:hypothetical protein